MRYTVLSIFGILFLIFGLSWIVQGNEFFLAKVFAPKEEQLRRETFEESKAYNQGAIQELQNMQFEYVKADKDQKKALAAIILHRAADFKEEKMPSDLRDFIASLRHSQENR